MVYFDKAKFKDQFIFGEKVLGFFEESRRLKSKRMSHWYLNWRINDAFLIDLLSGHVIDFTRELGLDPNCFYGVQEGATRLAVITQHEWARQSPNYSIGSHPLPMGRGKPKEHGMPKDRYFVGEPREKTIIIEDVTTTGGSLLDKIGDLKEMGDVELLCAFSLSNRMEMTPIPGQDREETVEKFKKIFERATGKTYKEAMNVEQAVQEAGLPFYAFSNALELLPEAYKRLNPGIEIARAIESEFEEYGIDKITLEV